MIESKFAFIGKIFLITFILVNLPNFFPLNLFNVSYLLILTTTIFDTSTLLVLSLSISKLIHKSQLIKIENHNNQDVSEGKLIERANSYKNQLDIDNKISFILAISLAFFTLIQPIILIVDINNRDISSSYIVNSINSSFNDQKSIIEELILKEKSLTNDKNELDKLESRITNLTILKDKNIDDILKNNNNNKFANVKVVLRNILLGVLFVFCFFKIYKI